MSPDYTIYFDPLGLQDAWRTAHVWVDTGIAHGLPKRPWIITLGGGGWAKTSGQVPATWTPTTGDLLDQLYNAGWAIIRSGYTTLEDTPGMGVFHPDRWDYSAGFPRLNPAKLERRHAQLDIVNLVQHIRTYGVPGISDLDQRADRGTVWGRSAGSIAASWIAFNPDMAQPRAKNARYKKSTRIGATVQTDHISSAVALPATYKLNHLAGETSRKAPAAIEDIPDYVHGRCWPLRWAWYPSKVPCYLSGDGTVYTGGPWDWDSFQDVLTASEIHASDHVKATEQLPGHSVRSVFLDGAVPGTWDDDVFAWLDNLVTIAQ